MSYEKLEISGLGSDVYSWMKHPISSNETNMIRNMSRLPGVYRHISIMADGHLGKGSMVGTVMVTKDCIAPAVTGVDIGCGMNAVLTPFTADALNGDGELRELRMEIEAKIPVGFNKHEDISGTNIGASNWRGWETFNVLHEGVQDRKANAMLQLGTLGGGELIATTTRNSR